jgi:hypothetical protein
VSSFTVMGAPIQKLPSLARNGAKKIVVATLGTENPGCNVIVKSSKQDAPRSSVNSLVLLSLDAKQIGLPEISSKPDGRVTGKGFRKTLPQYVR